MKKLLLIGLILSCMGASAQQSSTALAKAKAIARARMNPKLLKMRIPVSKNRNVDNGTVPYNNNPSKKPVARQSIVTAANETTIGNTYYDLQTNNTISNRIVNNGDGSISAVWTFSPDFQSGYPNRGTGYNYYSGSSWGSEPTQRIEIGEGNKRDGFVNIGVTSTGQEAVIGHGIQTSGATLGMLYTSRSTKGTGDWNVNDTLLGEEPADTIDIWAKEAVGGSDGQTIHAIWRGGAAAGKILGQTGPVLYSRSTDNGVTWSLDNLLPLIDSDYYAGFSADEYSIDAKGSVVAIVVSSIGEDVVLLKSTDNGDTWTKSIVSQYPIPFFNGATMTTDTNNDGIADTLWSGSGDANLVIDNNNEVHVFFSMFPTLCTTPGTAAGDGLNYFLYSTELFYWNESMADNNYQFIAYAPDLNGNGTIDLPAADPGDCPNDQFPFGEYGITRILEDPSAGVDANNNLYVCYQTVDELSDPGTVASNDNKVFKHPYMIKSQDGGTTWTPFDSAYDVLKATRIAIGDAEQLEGVYACMAKRVDNQIHIIYQRDFYPGTSLDAAGDCEATMNAGNSSDIVYVGVDTSLAVTGIPQLPGKTYGVMVSANFPNPASTSTQFDITLNTALNVKLDVTDILGQNIYSENKGKLSAGVHTVTLNTSYLSSGVYLYTVTAGNERVTGKMIVR